MDYNALWFKFGGGFDFNLTQALFIRTNALFGLRLPNQREMDTHNVSVGYGPELRVALGWKFK
jgi:hypothetical protein